MNHFRLFVMLLSGILCWAPIVTATIPTASVALPAVKPALQPPTTVPASPTPDVFAKPVPAAVMLPFVTANISRALPVENELYRIKIENNVSGSITYSRDKGATWQSIGSVIYPNIGFVHQIQDGQFTASDWAPVGSVAATAVNALHIKVDNIGPHPKLFSILPRELTDGQLVAGSYRSEITSIITDIEAGSLLFGNQNGVRVGDPVYLVSGNETIPWPESKAPELGDSIVIISQITPTADWSIEFENRSGGSVWFALGEATPNIVATVEKPVSGSGRFLGGRFQGEGKIRANHPGVIDISTSPKGELGGFQIVPLYHSMAPNLAYVKSTPAYMIVRSLSTAPLEGTFPLYHQLLRPGDSVEAKIGGKWQKLPESIGLNPTGLSKVESFRIRPFKRFLKLSD